MDLGSGSAGAGGTTPVGARAALEHALLGLVPVMVTAFVVYKMYADGNAAVDFQHSFWTAGWRTLHGLDPYGWTRAQISGGVSFPYPALAALTLAPFAAISSATASIPVTAVCIACAPLSLRILGIRDWRVYGAAALWAPVVVAWQTANFTLPLMLGIALLWRWRDQRWASAVAVACLVSLKPIMAPLWAWLALTRRWRTALLAAAIGVVLNAVAWTVVGWHEFGSWLRLLSRQGGLRDGTGYSLIALARHIGVASQIGAALMIACGCGLAWLALVAMRGGHERRAFAAAVLLTIVISPQIDTHYFALVLIPLALARPRLSWPWLAPLALWACPATHADLGQIVLWWVLLGVLATDLLAARGSPPAAELERAIAPSERRGVLGAPQAGC